MKKLPIFLFVLVLAGIVIGSAAFIVDETEQVFLTQFGKPVGGSITNAGIHFKIPGIQKAHSFNKQFLEWDGDANQLPTRDKRYIYIDTYARWRIQDALLFYQKVNDEIRAQSRLDDILDGATRNAVARHDLVEIVRSQKRADRTQEMERDADEVDMLPDFKVGREAIARDILESARVQLLEWGIELLDIRFKRIRYQEDIQQNIYQRMISERQRIASRFRSEGEGEAAKISGQRERELKTVQSEAFRKVQEIEGAADAKASAIYAEAYDTSPETREFYKFLKTMETLEKILSERDTLLLSTESDLYRYLKSAAPQPMISVK